MISRHDFTKGQRELLNYAVQIQLLDAVELGVLIANHGPDMEAIRKELDEFAWVLRTGSEEERNRRNQWITARNWVVIIVDADPDGRNPLNWEQTLSQITKRGYGRRS